jgi:transcription elongation GreA/GreB family factor
VHYQSEKLEQNKISNYTSIGKAIWAKHEGTEVDIDFPNGAQRVRILSIENTK